MAVSLLLTGFPGSMDRGWLGWSTVVLLKQGKKNILFDTGNYNDRAQLIDRLQQHRLTPQDIDQVVLSHLHFDHVMNIDLFRNAEIFVGAQEREQTEDLATPQLYLERLSKSHQVNWIHQETALCASVTLLPTPGHTPGSISLLFQDQQKSIILCGDAVKSRREYNGCRNTPSVTAWANRADWIVPRHDKPFTREGVYCNAPAQNRIQADLETPCTIVFDSEKRNGSEVL